MAIVAVPRFLFIGILETGRILYSIENEPLACSFAKQLVTAII
jgi:hypothetical protein